ncbi:MAG: crotonase/enoyl-CoA hydratase family protein [Myxococcota bacterium]
MATLTIERSSDHVIEFGLNRPDKLNAFNLEMLRELGEAMTAYEEDDTLRCAVLFAHGKSFTAGLDLAEVGPAVASGEPLFPQGGVDPLGLGRRRSKPLVMAVHGWCLTIGIELCLAADIRVAAPDTRFGQIEINRGIFPFGGATLRWPAQSGWGDAMRWLLTGDKLGAEEAHRIGLIQELAADPHARATELAQTIASRAPLGVQATLRNAWLAAEKGPQAASDALLEEAQALMKSEDAAEGMKSFVERREAKFSGK